MTRYHYRWATTSASPTSTSTSSAPSTQPRPCWTPHPRLNSQIILSKITESMFLTPDRWPGPTYRRSAQYPALGSCSSSVQALTCCAPMLPDPLSSDCLNKVPRQIVGHLWFSVIYYWGPVPRFYLRRSQSRDCVALLQSCSCTSV